MTDQQIAKWIDQLQGELDVLKRTAGGGTAVEITPTQDSGNKVADVSIDGVITSLFTGAVLPLLDDTTNTATLIDCSTYYIKCKYMTGNVAPESTIPIGLSVHDVIWFGGVIDDVTEQFPLNGSKAVCYLWETNNVIRFTSFGFNNTKPYRIMIIYKENKPSNVSKKKSKKED